MKTKRLLSMILVVVMILSVIPFTTVSSSAAVAPVATTSYEGSGTESDPYIAKSASDLAGFIHSDKNLHIKIGANITLSGSIFVESNITIDMNGYTITSNATSYAFRITQGHNLKIKGTGKIKYTDNLYIFYVDGTLETNGTVTYECSTQAGTIICTSDYGKVIINGGNFIGQQILINGVGKLYVYGGNFATEILINKTSGGYIYGGSFNGRIVNYNALLIYGGEFLKDVSSYGEGVTGIYAGHFKEGIANNSTGGRHIMGDNSLCIEHKSNNVSENDIFINIEMTVLRPDFAVLSPEVPEGQTEVDAGVINALDDYVVSFKAKDLPDIFVKNGFTIEEKLVVKDSAAFVEYSESNKGTVAKGLYYNLQNLDGDNYTIEMIVNLYRNGELCETNKKTVKISVNPLSNSDFGFKTMTPSVSAEDKAERYTDLGDIEFGTSIIFGYTPQLSQSLINQGYSVKETIYVNRTGKGTIATLSSGKNFDLMKYVDDLGDYQVWFSIALYRGTEYVTSIGHIYDVTITPIKVNTIKANVTKPVAGALPDATVTPAGEGYETTDVDWSYYDETAGEYYIMPEGMTFEAGKTYECAVRFDALGEYTFPEDKGYLAGYINGYRGTITSVYSTKRAYVTVNFTVIDDSLKVMFTPDSKAEAGCKLTVDIEAMAELDDDLMQAYFDEDVTYKWFYDGRLQTATKNNSYEINNSMIGHYIAVKVEYGNKSVTSEEFEITKASETGMRGDVDNDKKVSVMDATTIQMYAASLIDLTADQKKRGDVDNDTKVSVLDATKIQMFVALLIPVL